MQKSAQKRNILNKIREMADIPSASLEKFFNPEMKRVMASLVEADDNIRTILSGDKVGVATISAPEGGKSVKDILKSAHSNFNRREYILGITDLSTFHKRMYDVSKFISALNMNVDKIHHNFLFQGIGNKEKDQIARMKEHMSSLADKQMEVFIKEAGIMDFFHNVGTKRGRALAAWEKKYPNVAKDIREHGNRLLDQADNVLSNTLALLKEMATYRASRKVDSYMDAAHRIQKEYNKFDGGDKGFRAYYSNIVVPWLNKFEEWESARSGEVKPQATTVSKPTELGKQEVGNPFLNPLTPEQKAKTVLPPRNPLQEYLNVGTTEKSPAQDIGTMPTEFAPPSPVPNISAPGYESTAPKYSPINYNPPPAPAYSPINYETLPAAPPPMSVAPASNFPEDSEYKSDVLGKEFWGSKAHQQFIKSLEKLGNEDPKIVANFICKYAKRIEKNEPQAAIELFAIAKKMK